jgi:thymidylate synthase (FAD)
MTELRLITEPNVYVISRPQLTPNAGCHATLRGDEKGVTLDADSDADNLCELAGRVCYDSFKTPRPGGNAAYLRHILESGHGSVLEHANWTFLFTGVSRSLTHELVRHRAGFSYSQESQRYVDESDVAFVVPVALLPAHRESLADEAADKELSAWLDTPEGKVAWANATVEPCPPTPPRRRAYSTWYLSVENAAHDYRELAGHLADAAPDELAGTERRKHARQAARSVLPNCCETRIVVTANARAWRTFLEQRGSRGAEPEIRRLANRVLAVLHHEAPSLFSDYTVTALPDGTAEIVTPHRKV